MFLEPVDQSKSWVLKILLMGLVIASVPGSPAAAQRKANHASVWGPMFRSQVERCWRKPLGGDATVETAFAIRLTRAGWLLEPPLPESPGTSDYAMAYQNSAIKALNECQPYKLPIENYDEWKHFAPVFTERKGNAADGLSSGRTPSICRGC
jgi:hypothetical protein